ncbi:MAG: hypothetical protein AAGA00_13895 [Pseudomonadota bacterium]
MPNQRRIVADHEPVPEAGLATEILGTALQDEVFMIMLRLLYHHGLAGAGWVWFVCIIYKKTGFSGQTILIAYRIKKSNLILTEQSNFRQILGNLGNLDRYMVDL